MKVFKFKYQSYETAIGSPSLEEAKVYFYEISGEIIDGVKIDEIPESKWDEKIINILSEGEECLSGEHDKISIREALEEGETSIVFTTDNSLFD